MSPVSSPTVSAPARAVPAAPQPTAPCGDAHRLAATAAPGRLTALLRRHVGTLSIAALLIVTGTASIATPGGGTPGASFDVREMLLSLVRVDDPLALVVVLALALVVCVAAEAVMGTRRLLAAFFGGGLVVGVLGRVLAAFEENVIPVVPLNAPPTAGAPPLAALLTVALAASCFAAPRWRRRVRLIGVVFAVTLFLYAASAGDMYALIALPVGAGAGLLMGGTRSAGVLRSSRSEQRVLLAALTVVFAVGPVVATVWGSGAGLLSVYGWLSYDPLASTGGTVCAIGSDAAPCALPLRDYAELQPWAGWIAALPQVVLLITAWGILRGRRGALHLAVAMNLLTVVAMTAVIALTETDTLRQLTDARSGYAAIDVWQTLLGMVVGALLPLAAALVLIRFRSAARIASAPAVRRRFVAMLAIAAGGTLVLAVFGILTFSSGFRPWPSLPAVLATLPLRLLPPSLLPSEALSFVPVTVEAQATWYLLPLAFWVVVIGATVRFVVGSRATAGAPDRERAQALLAAGSGDTLAHMTLWEGNSYWFAADVEAAIAYRVRGRFAVTLGGPFGPDRDDPALAAAFVDFCEERGWTAVFYSVDDADRARLASLGWHELRVAEEASLDPQTWMPTGKKRQDVRTATNRAEREGVTAEWTRWSAVSVVARAQIRDISEAWVADKTIPEMEFTLGSTDQLADPAVRLLVARDAHDRIVAFTSWIPVHRDGAVAGYALDVMRRREGAMNGVMEFLIGRAVEQLRADGMTVMSLSGSPLARHDAVDDGDRSSIERGLDVLSALLEPAYGFRSLATFKKKFQPEFSPLWMVSPDPALLPAIGVALVRCYIPGLTLRGAVQLTAALRRSRETTSA